ncbi:MAG: antibiotic biosynthesis monooxygenase [Pseudomonadota bacterium]
MGVVIKGFLRCGEKDAAIVRGAVGEHIRLSRAEPGCEHFEITETEPGVFSISERFVDEAAFEAHTQRTRASEWWTRTRHIPRDIEIQS